MWFFYLCKLSGNVLPRPVLTTHLNLLKNTMKTKAEKLSRSRLRRQNYLIGQIFFTCFPSRDARRHLLLIIKQR